MDKITYPGEPRPTRSPLIRNLTILASALAAASVTVNLILQVATFLKKRPVQSDQRDTIQTAKVTLLVLRTLPTLIRQVRLLVSQLRAA